MVEEIKSTTEFSWTGTAYFAMVVIGLCNGRILGQSVGRICMRVKSHDRLRCPPCDCRYDNVRSRNIAAGINSGYGRCEEEPGSGNWYI